MRNKALAVAALLLATFAGAQSLKRLSRIGPTAATLVSSPGIIMQAAGVQWATIAAAASPGRNCLSYMDASSVTSSTMTLRVLDGSTTIYAIDVSSSFSKHFDGDEMCGSAATAMYVQVSTAHAVASPITFQKLSYGGFTY